MLKRVIDWLKTAVVDWLKVAGELRDGFLVIGAIIYFLGYTVWAINAYQNNLGLLPIVEVQYFVAGTLLAFFIMVLVLTFKGSIVLKKMIRDWVGSTPIGAKLYLTKTVLSLGLLSSFLVLAIWLPVERFEKFRASTPNWIWLWCFLALVVWVSTLFIPALPKRNPQPDKQETIDFANFYQTFGFHRTEWLYSTGQIVSFWVFYALIGASFIFIVDLYSMIPQEFGGVLPRHAYLDITKTQLSKETIDEILPPGATESVVRSNRVEILFSGSDVMIIRSEKNRKIFSLTKSTIQTVNPQEENPDVISKTKQ